MLHPNDLIVTQHQQEMRRAAQQRRLVRAAQSSRKSRLNSQTVAEALLAIVRRPAAPTLNTRHAR